MKRIIVLLGLTLFVTVPLAFVAAQSREGYDDRDWYRDFGRNSSLNRKINRLDDDVVKNLPIPILYGVSVSNLTDNFGDPRSGGRMHEGLDIAAPRGTPIVSPTDAVVLRTGEGSSAGYNVYTANPGEETFVYMHLDRIAPDLDEGDEIKKGTLIGYVGNTGNASGGAPHLHFEIKRDGEALDPLPRLTLEFTAEEREEYAEENDLNLPANVERPMATEVRGSGSFSRDLEFGAVGEDVRALQKMLNAHGYTVAASGPGSHGQETTYFGPATQRAVIAFQVKNNISPTAGYFGPKTRAAFALLNIDKVTLE